MFFNEVKYDEIEFVAVWCCVAKFVEFMLVLWWCGAMKIWCDGGVMLV